MHSVHNLEKRIHLNVFKELFKTLFIILYITFIYVCTLNTCKDTGSVQFENRENIVKKLSNFIKSMYMLQKLLTLLTANFYPIPINKINTQSWHVGLKSLLNVWAKLDNWLSWERRKYVHFVSLSPNAKHHPTCMTLFFFSFYKIISRSLRLLNVL